MHTLRPHELLVRSKQVAMPRTNARSVNIPKGCRQLGRVTIRQFSRQPFAWRRQRYSRWFGAAVRLVWFGKILLCGTSLELCTTVLACRDIKWRR